MSSLVFGIPVMPYELVDHDVYRDEWVLFMNVSCFFMMPLALTHISVSY
jgi:hypothetical protein